MALSAVIGARAGGIHTVMAARAVMGVAGGSGSIVLPVYFGEVARETTTRRATSNELLSLPSSSRLKRLALGCT